MKGRSQGGRKEKRRKRGREEQKKKGREGGRDERKESGRKEGKKESRQRRSDRGEGSLKASNSPVVSTVAHVEYLWLSEFYQSVSRWIHGCAASDAPVEDLHTCKTWRFQVRKYTKLVITDTQV